MHGDVKSSYIKMKKCHAYRVGDNIAIKLDVRSKDTKAKEKDPIAIHFVLDNSASMGQMTQQVLNIFSKMVDSTATAPCSLTVFQSDGENPQFQIAKQMLEY